MNFKSRGRPLSATGMSQACAVLAVAAAEIWAVLTVETRAFGFFADRRPQILFERHIFHQRTNGRFTPTRPDISNPVTGGYAGGTGEYPRLESAMLLDHAAALQSASWGIGQVMGFNADKAGFGSVDEMVAAMVLDEDTQLAASANFIHSKGLVAALQKHDWEQFARGYNGKDFAKNDYATRLAGAYASFCIVKPDLSYRAAQAALSYLGFNPGLPDGIRGRITRSALAGFQKQYTLPQTGELDAETESTLMAAAFP